ncbi:MAG TPA: hypothetical protein VFS51_08925 [Gemmatimonadales bacterium]|nr:hypothetical protein [Gemmatimonadales bacterium]
MRQPFNLSQPKRSRWPWIAIAASIGVHSLLLFGWVTGRIPEVPRLPRQLIVLSAPAEGPEHVVTPYQVPQATDATERPQSRRRTPGRRPDRRDLPATPEVVRVLPTPDALDQPRVDTGSAPVVRAPAPVGRIAPGFADGRLWVRPLPLPPRELAQRLTRSHAELVDSAVTAVVQAYLDSIANDPATKNAGLPSWTTEIAGKKFGIDSKNIYIAGLKIPAAVLALLPLTGGGNIDQNRAYNRLMDLRQDLLYAARRAETMEEFKQIIREIRERKERERELERNQRTAPPPEEPLTP